MIRIAPGSGALVWQALGYRAACDAVDDPRGLTVRSTPRRVTLMQDLVVVPGVADGSSGQHRSVRLFRKVRLGAVAAAEQEWHGLDELSRRGFRVADPVFFARSGERTVVATRAVRGRPLGALFLDAGADASLDAACSFVGVTVRRLHAGGLVFRDLYWNHLFATDVSLAAEPTFIDVERLLRPRWRWRRWVVKDLAGLVSSWPFADVAPVALALVRAYLGAADRALTDAVLAKAARIRRHVPKYGA
ncbi:MAG: lipopolysaccharide kinase InaA family protein [Planctomycetota bacterium]